MDAVTGDQLVEFLAVAAHAIAFGLGVIAGALR